MPREVRFDAYGDVDVLYLADVPAPEPAAGQVVVRMLAAGLNPDDATRRRGLARSGTGLAFPARQGTDLAGVVERVGPGVVDLAVGDQVAGAAADTSHADFVVVGADRLVARCPQVPWEVAGAMHAAGTAAVAAVAQVDPQAGEVLLVCGAGGSVGTLATQLALRAGARVIAVAGDGDHARLAAYGAEPVTYGDGVEARVRERGARIAAVVDAAGRGAVALGVRLGVSAARIATLVDLTAARRHGARIVLGSAAAGPEVLRELLGLVSRGALELPIARTYHLDHVRAACRDLEARPGGKIVLVP